MTRTYISSNSCTLSDIDFLFDLHYKAQVAIAHMQRNLRSLDWHSLLYISYHQRSNSASLKTFESSVICINVLNVLNNTLLWYRFKREYLRFHLDVDKHRSFLDTLFGPWIRICKGPWSYWRFCIFCCPHMDYIFYMKQGSRLESLLQHYTSSHRVSVLYKNLYSNKSKMKPLD